MREKCEIRKLMLLLLTVSMTVCAQQVQQVPLRAVYHTPATSWENEALPIGNGYMGAMVYGGVYSDLIQTNEKTLWSGGPGQDAAYNGGHKRTPAENHRIYHKAQVDLQEAAVKFSQTKAAYKNSDGKVVTNDYDEGIATADIVNNFGGDKAYFGSFQTMSNITVDDLNHATIDGSSIYANYDNRKNAGERAINLFDGNKGNKWFADDDACTVDKKFPIFITWSYYGAPTVTGYSVTSANDMPGRDPKHWILYGSKDGLQYNKIDEQNGLFWNEQRNTTVTFKANFSGYRFFKFEILELVDNSQKPQLAEIGFLTASTYANYTRMLDIDHSLLTINYDDSGISYSREYFMSYPDRVMVIRLKANRPFSKRISIDCPHADKTLEASDHTITLTGYPTGRRNNPNWKQGLRFAQIVRIASTDGTVAVDGNAIVVTSAREIVLLMSAATNYQQCMDDSYDYFSDEDPLAKVQMIVSEAASKSYETLLARHQEDYQSLYDRMKLNLNVSAAPAASTDQLLAAMSNSTATLDQCNYLETLYYQFGRYLLISSSRQGSLPANLQGVWGQSLNNPWNADYHTNINVEMNYWPAEQTNLAECHMPMIEFVQSLVPRGKYTATYYYCKPDGVSPVRGWACNHEVNIWGNTAPGESSAHFFPQGAIWMCQDIWEHYLFTMDKVFLEKYYDTMLQAALFWVDNLWTDSRDGKLVCNPSYSPEHGAFSLGCSTSQAMVQEMFDMMIKASKALGRESDSEIVEIKNAMARLSGPQIGLGGQFMEWKDEVTKDITGDGHHRHTNHLFWLHPGSQIVAGRSAQDDLYAKAMKVTLNTRGDEGTGWSRAWKLNFWARLHDGERAHKLLQSAMHLTTPSSGVGGVYPNLFDAHPPFQIDGNFGVTSGVAEMLLQSQGGYIELLPALPFSWMSGSFSGLKARGNFEVSASWSDGKLMTASIKSRAGETCVIKYPGAKDFSVSGTAITVISDNMISFPTQKGMTYDLRTTTGIQTMAVAEEHGKVYNLSGMLMQDKADNIADLHRGIYVLKGKKVVVE